jgi:hypothetical protein
MVGQTLKQGGEAGTGFQLFSLPPGEDCDHQNDGGKRTSRQGKSQPQILYGEQMVDGRLVIH